MDEPRQPPRLLMPRALRSEPGPHLHPRSSGRPGTKSVSALPHVSLQPRPGRSALAVRLPRRGHEMPRGVVTCPGVAATHLAVGLLPLLLPDLELSPGPHGPSRSRLGWRENPGACPCACGSVRGWSPDPPAPASSYPSAGGVCKRSTGHPGPPDLARLWEVEVRQWKRAREI